MVAKVITGKTIRGVLSYNENKVKQGTAICTAAEGFPGEASRIGFQDKLNTFFYYLAKNPKTKTNAVHISLNFDKEDKLDPVKVRAITYSYLNKIGFIQQPFLVYQHFDSAHPHLHIVTTNIQIDGRRIDLHNLGRNQSEKARKEIEIDFNLIKAEGRRQADLMLKPADLSKAQYGKSETKRSITNIVNAVTRSYRFTSIHELNAVLKQYNVIADAGKEGTMIHSKNGLVYSIINKEGLRVGVPIKASSIYGKPTMANLSGLFEVNEMLRRPHKDRVREVIDRLCEKPIALDSFIAGMVAREIYPVVRQNAEGRIYGLTFIDNKTKCVFNGSDLGKQYSAKAILERLENLPIPGKVITAGIPTKEEDVFKQKDDLLLSENKNAGVVPELLKTLTSARQDYSLTPQELKRRKKKRRGRSI